MSFVWFFVTAQITPKSEGFLIFKQNFQFCNTLLKLQISAETIKPVWKNLCWRDFQPVLEFSFEKSDLAKLPSVFPGHYSLDNLR